MLFDLETKKVTPDPSMGKVQVFKEDEATVFKWINIKTGQADDDLYTFPQQAVFEKVKNSKARIYLLRYLDSDRRHFYWLQEQDPSKDEALCKRVNDAINVPIQAEEEVKAPVPQVSQPVGAPTQAALDARALSQFMQMLAGQRQAIEESTSLH